MAQPIRCVNETLPRLTACRCSFMILRFSSRSLTGIFRKLVAVGTDRLCSMFSTIFFAAPVRGLTSASGETVGVFVVGTLDGGVSAFGVAFVSDGCVAAVLPLAPRRRSAKYVCQDSSTE